MAISSAQTATLANVATSTTAATIFAANGSARVRVIWNDSAAALLISFNGTASATNATTSIAAGATYTLPAPLFCGAVSGVLASGTGAARTTEY